MTSVRLDLTERVAWLTLDGPPHNLLDAPAIKELDRALEDVSKNREASVVVLSGAGDVAFCGGLAAENLAAAELAELVRVYHLMMRKLVRLPQAVVMAVDGVALGAGFELVSVGDIAVASDRSRFGLPEIRHSALPCVATVVLPTVCGRPVASDLILTGSVIDAARAKAVGLVSRVFPTDDFDESLRSVVAHLAEHEPMALRKAAETLRGRWLAGFEQGLQEVERVALR